MENVSSTNNAGGTNMEESFWKNNKPHIAKNLEKRLQRDSAPCHMNGNAKTSEVHREDEYTTLFRNVVERMAKRLVESGETFSVLNHVEPHHFKDALALAVEYSGFGAGEQIIDPRTNDSMVYRYLVGLEFEQVVITRAEQLLHQDYERWQLDEP